MVPRSLNNKIQVSITNNTLVASISSNVEFFDYVHLHEFIQRKGIEFESVILDFTDAPEINSAAIGALISFTRNMKLNIKLVYHQQSSAHRTFNLLKLSHLFDTYYSLQESLESCA